MATTALITRIPVTRIAIRKSSSYLVRSMSAAQSIIVSHQPRHTLYLNTKRMLRLSTPSLRSIDSEDEEEEAEVKQCWRCDKPIGKYPGTGQAVVKCDHCGTVQHLSNEVNYFALFNLDTRYDIDLAILRKRYLRLQQNMHPDMNVNRSNTETEYSLDNSSIINSAYQTLRDPYQRALYLLRTVYNITIDEANIETEPELLLEIMELNEDIEMAATDKESLEAVNDRIADSIRTIESDLRKAFELNNGSEARKLAIRFSYYNSALSKLKSQLVDA